MNCFYLFQRWLCIRSLTYSHHTTSNHSHIHAILNHTTGRCKQCYITLQLHWHHTTSHRRHIHIIINHTTIIFTTHYITPEAYPNQTTHHRPIHTTLHHITANWKDDVEEVNIHWGEVYSPAKWPVRPRIHPLSDPEVREYTCFGCSNV